MHLDPLLQAPRVIQVHAVMALLALGLGILQLLGPKGTMAHRFFGWSWVILMAVTALSSFFINDIRTIGPFSYIHLLSILTLTGLIQALVAVRRGQVSAHAKGMKSLFFFALIVAGAFTLLPGRIMGDVVFGFPHHSHMAEPVVDRGQTQKPP